MRFELGLADSTRKGGIPVASYLTDVAFERTPLHALTNSDYKYNRWLLSCQITVSVFGYQQVGEHQTVDL